MNEHDTFCEAFDGGRVCICDEIAMARADEREKAAQRLDAVLDPRSWCSSPPHSDSTCDCGKEIALAAIRGDVPCTHTRAQYTREVCWCGDAVDMCEDCGEDIHDCAVLKEGKPV